MQVARVGFGYDVHRLISCENSFLPICGVSVPCNFKVEAHSDGDVGLHALTEAILGAIANGNIGTHFPSSEQKWHNAASKIFVNQAVELLKGFGGTLINADITIICEEPKVMPYSLQMRCSVAELLGVDVTQVSVKATTTEKMGFLGRGEGIAAHAICSIQKLT